MTTPEPEWVITEQHHDSILLRRAPFNAPPTDSPPEQEPAPTRQATAATRFGWGQPHPLSDEFNYTGPPDPSRWSTYQGPGHDQNGRRRHERVTVANGFMRQTGLTNGDSAGMRSRVSQKYGRWEVRMRASTPGGPGRAYHPVLITWPTTVPFPQGAEYDFLEFDIGHRNLNAFLHFPNHQPRRQEHATGAAVDYAEWHNYGFEWTPEHVRGFFDGEQWFSFNRDGIQRAPGPMHQTIQLDNYSRSGPWQPGVLDVEWARVYAL